MIQTKMPAKTKRTSAHWWEHETRIPIACPKKLGLDVNVGTLRDWINRGCFSRRTQKRVHLEAIQVGQSLCTSIERVNSFLARLNGVE